MMMMMNARYYVPRTSVKKSRAVGARTCNDDADSPEKETQYSIPWMPPRQPLRSKDRLHDDAAKKFVSHCEP